MTAQGGGHLELPASYWAIEIRQKFNSKDISRNRLPLKFRLTTFRVISSHRRHKYDNVVQRIQYRKACSQQHERGDLNGVGTIQLQRFESRRRPKNLNLC